MIADRPLPGLALMLLFCVLAPLADALAKLAGDTIPLLQLVAARFAVQAGLLVPLVLLLRRSLRVAPGLWPSVVARTALHVVGIALMFLSLRHLPLADAIAIAYVMPFLVLLAGAVFLGESVGWRRLAACAAGFSGTLLVLQPAFAEIGPPALLPLGVAVVFAAFVIVTRRISRAIGPMELQAVNGLMGSAVLLPLAIGFAGSGVADLTFVRLDARALGLLLGVGLLGTLAHLALTWSLRFAPAATLAPIQYLEIPFAVAIGYAVFADLPGPRAALGIGLVMAAGFAVIGAERRLAARAARHGAPPPPPPTPPAAG